MKKPEIKDLYSVMYPEYPDVVNVEQLSEMLGGVSTKTVYRLLKKGDIQSKYIGKRYIIPKLSVIDYITRQQQ